MIFDTDNISEMPDAAWAELYGTIQREQVRRDVIGSADQQLANIVSQYQEASGLHQEVGAPWVEPTGYLDAYPLDFEVTHNGKTWVALRNGASGEPGVVTGDWQEKQVEGEYTEWVQPYAGSEYPVGALVTHKGHKWRNDHTGPNGWEPGATGSQWTDLGAV